MNKKYIFLTLLLTIIITFIAIFIFQKSEKKTNVQNKSITSYRLSAKDESTTYLYFLDMDCTYLIGEERPFLHSPDPVEYGRAIIQAIIDGPKERLIPTVPQKTQLKALHISRDGVAYVDLSENIESDHPGGSMLEYFTIFSIVNSLVLNVPDIKTVKFLKGGCEALTLAGHIDIRLPFKANMLLVR